MSQPGQKKLRCFIVFPEPQAEKKTRIISQFSAGKISALFEVDLSGWEFSGKTFYPAVGVMSGVILPWRILSALAQSTLAPVSLPRAIFAFPREI